MPPTADVPALMRKHIYDHFLEHAVPPVVEQLMLAFSLSREETENVLRELEAARQLVLVKGTARILMAWPFSAIATPFRVEVGGRRYFANCAWDAVAFHAMTGQPIRIDSSCHHCAAPITIELRDGRAVSVEPAEALVYLAIPAARWWDDIILTCSNTMVFFASEAHRDASALCSADGGGASLTPEQTHVLSGPVYGPRMELGYTRPPRQELLDHFASMGLTGDFWAL
ncbi:MAG TPA: alkylmercury lyase family protein [Candidatus Limnocylindrales bacterium]|nr:alkylmercury lyase family protein [Candidatus Limnocylindrales bacterium]